MTEDLSEAMENILAHSHTSSIRTWRRRSVGSRRTSVSSEKAALLKDEDNLSLPDVEEGQETKQNFVGFEEGNVLFFCVM